MTRIIKYFPVLFRKYLLKELFNGSSLNLHNWTVTDTESKLSLNGAGQLSCSGGLATPAWDNPRITSTKSFPVTRGLTLEGEVNFSSFGATIVGFDVTTPIVAELTPGVTFKAASVAGSSGATKMFPYVPATATSYRIRIVHKNPGALYYISSDNGATWGLLGEDTTVYTSPVYAGITEFTGAFTSDFLRVFQGGSVKAPLVNVASVAGITPTLGAEMFTDPGLEGNYTTGLNDNLTIGSGTPTLAEAGGADVHGGSKAQSFIATVQYDRLLQNKTLVTGTFYQVFIWAKRTAGTGGGVYGRFYNGGTLVDLAGYTDASYTQKLLVTRAEGTGGIFRVIQDNNSTNFDTVIIDDASIKPLTLSTCLGADGGDASVSDYIASIDATLTAKTQYGLMLNVDDADNPVNFLLAYHNGTNATLLKCVAGTYTSLIDTAATYVAGQTLKVVKIDTKVVLYYNNLTIGTIQTVSDAGIISNTKHYPFSTYSSNSGANYSIQA